MKERLSKIITVEGLNPSILADEIGVQRSGISHLLSGRNYPSFDFLQKILERFPKLSAEWLILGRGSMYKSTVAGIPGQLMPPQSVEKTSLPPVLPEKQPNRSSEEDHSIKHSKVESESSSTEQKKAIEKIVVLYTDKTFTTYFPE